jgi:uncharacterized protein (TIGR01777 family)
MKILLSGGTGLIGSMLTQALQANGHVVHILSRTPRTENEFEWDLQNGTIDPDALKGVDGVIHLAGAGIADKRWTASRKKLIIDSRVQSAELLKKAIRKSGENCRFFITASGVNYYGTVTNDHIYRETDPPGNDYLGDCCKQWEDAAFTDNPAPRVVALRTGVVLSAKGGALEKLSMPIRYGIGSPLGSGKQYVPWIHIRDLVALYLKAVEDETMQGAFNAVADEHVYQTKLTKTIAAKLGRKIWLPNVPAFALRLLLGEMSSIILEGSRISNEKVIRQGFVFRFPKLKEAIEDLV